MCVYLIDKAKAKNTVENESKCDWVIFNKTHYTALPCTHGYGHEILSSRTNSMAQ